MPIIAFWICLFASGQQDILLKDYDPISVYKTQNTKIEKAKFPIIDMHSHPYDSSPDEIESGVKTMDAVPRYTNAFYEKLQDKLVYGTDIGFERSMYETTFRILETEDEHFY